MRKTFREELYISVDIEASGAIPGLFSMLSTGACVVGDVNKGFYIELKPLNDNFDAEAMQFTGGLSLETLKRNGTDPKTAMAQFEQWIREVSGNKRPVFVAFGASFDWMFVHWYFITFLGRNPFGHNGIDIKAYYMGMKHKKWSETGRKAIEKEFPARTAHTHNALEDAIGNAEIFEQMLRANVQP
jgi:DNA polymerase III epsilon subunit-like protein